LTSTTERASEKSDSLQLTLAATDTENTSSTFCRGRQPRAHSHMPRDTHASTHELEIAMQHAVFVQERNAHRRVEHELVLERQRHLALHDEVLCDRDIVTPRSRETRPRTSTVPRSRYSMHRHSLPFSCDAPMKLTTYGDRSFSYSDTSLSNAFIYAHARVSGSVMCDSRTCASVSSV
jgi:hypothetical protein